MMQIYLLTVAYLLIGAALLLVDDYGGRFILLIRLRNSVQSSFRTLGAFALMGILLAVVKLFHPVPPGPVILGDIVPLASLIVLVVYHITQMVLMRRKQHGDTIDRFSVNGSDLDEVDQNVVHRTRSLIELHKRNLGYVMLSSALLHMFFPQAVLL